MEALWRVYLYSRYGETKDLGFIIHNADTVPSISKNYKGKRIDEQPTCVSFDIIKYLKDGRTRL